MQEVKEGYIVCPNCRIQGRNVVLGLLTPEYFSIKRHGGAMIKVSGSNYLISCGICNEQVFRREENEGFSDRLVGIRGQTLNVQIGTA